MYFKLFKPQDWGKRSGESRRRLVWCFRKKMKGGNQMKTRKKWLPGGRQRQSAAYHRRAVHKRKRVVRLRVWKKGEKNGVVAEV